jgi:hypothetical protein
MDSAQTKAESENDELRGLYLVPPHGELIASGKKKSIAKSRQFALEGKWILVSGKFAYGTMKLGEPEKVSTREFDDKYEDHLVSRQDRLRWWPNARELYLYPVLDFEGYAKPKKVEVPPGVQTVMREVDFKQRSDDLLGKLDGLPDKFVWIPDFVALTGSQIYAKSREPRDVDIILRAETAEDGEHFQVPVDGAMALKLERVLCDLLGTEEVQYTANAYGPNWKHLPLYDLALVRKSELKYYEPDEAEFAAMEYKAWKEDEKRWVTLKDGRRVVVSGSEHRSSDVTLRAETTLRSKERKICDDDKETGIFVGRDGKVAFSKGGEEHLVNYTAAEIRSLKELDDLVMTHNHPSGRSFSREDLEFAAIVNLAEVRAIGRDSITGRRYIHRIPRPENGWPSKTELGRAIGKADSKVKDSFCRQIGSGEMTIREANLYHWHNVWKSAAHELGLNYSRKEI